MAKNKKKRKIASVLSILLVLALAVGGTFALYTYYTAGQTNTFTFVADPKSGIAITIQEPAWNQPTALNIGDLSSAGTSVPKNPSFTNSSATSKADVYGALRIVWVKGDGTALSQSEFDTYVKPYVSLTALDTTDYTGPTTPLSAPKEVYYYNNAVAYNASSKPLFTAVAFSAATTSDANDYLAAQQEWITWGGFEIVVEGSAVDTTGLANAAAAQTQLAGLFSTSKYGL